MNHSAGHLEPSLSFLGQVGDEAASYWWVGGQMGRRVVMRTP